MGELFDTGPTRRQPGESRTFGDRSSPPGDDRLDRLRRLDALARRVPPCDLCGGTLNGEALRDRWGQFVCTSHREQLRPCRFCYRVVLPPAGGQTADSYDTRCRSCRETAVRQIDETQARFAEVVHWARDAGLRSDGLELTVELASPDRLAHLLADRASGDTLGATVTLVYRQPNMPSMARVRGVALLDGLPASLFGGVVAHELGHVWLAAHGVLGQPVWAQEGLCSVLGHRYYRSVGTTAAGFHADDIERNRDPVYGDGFRRVNAVVTQYGLSAVLAHLSSTGQFPRGAPSP